MAYRKAETLEARMHAALTAKPPAESDKAIGDLALAYARRIDEDGVDYRLGPALLAALEALQMSPRARAQAHRGEVKDAPASGNPLDALAARRAGKSRAPNLDATAS